MTTASPSLPVPPTRLAPGAVEVWTVDLEQPARVEEELRGLLAADEMARAGRFVFDQHRRHFVVCRGALRLLLGAQLGMDPRAISFEYGSRGKPSLGGAAAGRLDFNVSHAAGVAVMALSTSGVVGVDVECATRTVDFAGLSARFFSAHEAGEIHALAAERRPEAFFNCWTRKEAYVKAIGDGLGCPLDAFAVTLLPGEPAALRWIAGDDACHWRMTAFQPRPQYVAALATPWAPRSVAVMNWELAPGAPAGLQASRDVR